VKHVKIRAFSLIELIFVIVVIAVIAVIAVPKFLNTKDEATISAIKQDISTTISAVQSYRLLNGTIAKFSDAVSLNSKVWSGVDTKKIEFKDTATCVSIEITDTALILTVNADVSKICKKISDSGVVSTSYGF